MYLDEKIKSYFDKKPYRKKKEVHSSFSNYVRDYFMFNKKERNGVLGIIGLIVLLTLAIFYLHLRESRTVHDNLAFQKQVDEFIASAVAKEDENDSLQNFISDEMASPSKVVQQLFVFNPNTATGEDFVKLGLTKKQAAGILNYRAKGGQFRRKEDFAKMYTLGKQDYERLQNFISIPEALSAGKQERQEEKMFTEQKIYEPKPRENFVVELNTADSLELIKVKGIGPYTAMKIIELRNKLGGFYSKEQLKEVYKVDSARYAEIESFLTVDVFEIKKININTATIDELKMHPYIRYNIANSLVSIRQQHGNFKTINDIKKSHLVTEENFRKIAAYLTLD